MPVAIYVGDIWTTTDKRPIERLILNIYLIPEGEIVAYATSKNEDAITVYGHHFRQWIAFGRAKRSVDWEFMRLLGEPYQGPPDGEKKNDA